MPHVGIDAQLGLKFEVAQQRSFFLCRVEQRIFLSET
jgi:hypothetical protein